MRKEGLSKRIYRMGRRMIRAAQDHFACRLHQREAAARSVTGEDNEHQYHDNRCELSPGHPENYASPSFDGCLVVPLGQRLFDVPRDEDSSSATVDRGRPRA